MVDRFISWLEGILEDDPLPEEIDILVFNIRQNGKYKYIELIGYENHISENQIAYYPLEAQHFICNEMAKFDDEKFIFECKYLIEECFVSNILKYQLKNKKIYLKNNNKIDYLLKVKYE